MLVVLCFQRRVTTPVVKAHMHARAKPRTWAGIVTTTACASSTDFSTFSQRHHKTIYNPHSITRRRPEAAKPHARCARGLQRYNSPHSLTTTSSRGTLPAPVDRFSIRRT